MTSRVSRDDGLVLRNPVAWPHHPLMTLTREEDGELVLGVLLDWPGIPPWRVFYADGDDVAGVLTRPDLPHWLSETYLTVDYRSLIHLLTDGWRID